MRKTKTGYENFKKEKLRAAPQGKAALEKSQNVRIFHNARGENGAVVRASSGAAKLCRFEQIFTHRIRPSGIDFLLWFHIMIRGGKEIKMRSLFQK